MAVFPRLQLEHILFLALGCAAFLFNNTLGYDYFWHLEAGKYLWQTLNLPHGDPFSFTVTGKPWVMHEWLFELMLYQVHEIAGHYGVKFAVTAIATATIYIVYRDASMLSRKPRASIFVATIAFSVFIQFSLPRPQIATYFFFAIYLHLLLQYRLHGATKALYWLAPLMLLWVNMHGGYLIGITIILIFTLAEVADRILQISDDRAANPPLRPLLSVLAFCLGISLINPYGYHQWLYPFQVMTMSASNLIVEWGSPNFHETLNKVYLLLVFSFFFAIAYSRRHPGIRDIIPTSFFIFMSFISIRHIPIALLILIPFLAHALSNIAIPQRLINNNLATWFIDRRHLIQNGRKLGRIEQTLNWTLLAILIAAVSKVHISSLNRLMLYDNQVLPVKAVDFIKHNGISGNILNDYAYGGYLMYRLFPDSRVFIDGRADLYGDQYIEDYLTIYYTKKGWRNVFERYNIDIVLLKNQSPALSGLQRDESFRLIYRDKTNSLLISDRSSYRKLIEHNPPPLPEM